MQELGRQIQVMQKKASTMASATKMEGAKGRADINKKMDANTELIHELNDLRAERKALAREAKDLELRVRLTENSLVLKQAEAQPSLANSAPQAAIANGPSASAAGGKRPMSSSGSRERLAAADPAARRAADGFSERAKAQASRSLPPPALGKGKLKKAPGAAHIAPEERKQMQKLLATVDMNNQQIQMQRLEHKLLADQLEKVITERRTAGSGAGSSASAGNSATSDGNAGTASGTAGSSGRATPAGGMARMAATG